MEDSMIDFAGIIREESFEGISAEGFSEENLEKFLEKKIMSKK